MRQKVSLLIGRVKAIVNIRNCTIAILIIVGLSIIFAIVIIMVPEPFQRIFPRARESIATLATAAMVFATLLLAYGTFRIIRSDRDRERRDRKERLLNEILEWAISIISLRAKSSYKPYSAKKSREMSATTKLELMGAFMDIHTKETYIRLLADKLGLKIFMLEVTRHLNNHIKLINLIFDGKVKNSEVMANHRRILNKSAESLITEATKIKAGDIS